jgi:LPS-assembly protein
MNNFVKFSTFIFFIAAVQINASAEEKTESISQKLKETSKKPANIEADSMHYDKEARIVTAEGSVEITQGEIILLSDKVTYNQNTNMVTAIGNVSLVEPGGNVFFADNMELKDDLKKGVINNFRVKFVDESRMSAKRAERINENLTVMNEVQYTPCKTCQEFPAQKPLWQVRAKKATIDEEKQRVKYNHAFFDIKGIPFLYTPYLSHPTPDAKRKSGFLIPKYSTDKIFGTTVRTPYYYNISPDKDLTLTPIITSKEGGILYGDYRQLMQSGEYNIKASITNPDKVDINGNQISGNDVRGHVEGSGNFKISEQWNWGFTGKRSTDDTYLEKYDFGEEDVLTSRVYATAIDDRNFLHNEAISFQGLRTNDDPGKTPLILPSVTGHYEEKTGFYDSTWTADANILALTRDEGVSSNRVSVQGGWNVPHVTDSGHVLELKTSLRGDSYFVDDVPQDPTNPNSRNLDGLASRVVPEAKLIWKLPMVNTIRNRQVFLEPTANFIASPYGGNPDKIPNEDAQDIEFSDENLFDSNHFTGYDRIESGPRVNYGLRGRVSDTQHGEVSFLMGQSYHAKENNNFSTRTGLDGNLSDFVGRVGYQKNEKFNIAYRVRLDDETFALNRNAVTAGVNLEPVRFDFDYLSVDESFDSSTTSLASENRELVLASTSIDLNKQWNVSGSGHRDLEDGEWVASQANLLYKGNCVDVSFSWLEEFTRDRDIRPNTTLSLQISLKNLGY